MIPIKETPDGIVLGIQVLPRSSQCKLAGCQGDLLKIKITAPPVEGRANEECTRFLADLLRVKRDRVAIVGGFKARKKTVAVRGLTRKEAEAALSVLTSSRSKW